MNVILILALVLALAATVLAFIFIVPAKKRERFNRFLKLVHDFLNFRFLIVEKLMQALYIFATAFVIFFGFCMLFYVESDYYNSYWHGGEGLLLMILGPVVLRVFYEFIMMALLLVKNVIQINSKLKNSNGEVKGDIFSGPGKGEYIPARRRGPKEPYAPQQAPYQAPYQVPQQAPYQAPQQAPYQAPYQEPQQVPQQAPQQEPANFEG